MFSILFVISFELIVFFGSYSIGEVTQRDRTLNIVDGVDTNKLTDEELHWFIEAEDEILIGKIDVWTGKRIIAVNRKKESRNFKRIAPPVARELWMSGRLLYRSLVRKTPKISRSAGKITKIYFKKGNYEVALKDFRRLRPSNVKRYKKDKGEVRRVGTILDGRWKVTVRSKNSSGRPTIYIYKTNKAHRKILREIYYQ